MLPTLVKGYQQFLEYLPTLVDNCCGNGIIKDLQNSVALLWYSTI
ncbi:MAG: hypothetical protein ACI8YQ_002982 [Polaribacter sp.]|jgi:hypothetical protein